MARCLGWCLLPVVLLLTVSGCKSLRKAAMQDGAVDAGDHEDAAGNGDSGSGGGVRNDGGAGSGGTVASGGAVGSGGVVSSGGLTGTGTGGASVGTGGVTGAGGATQLGSTTTSTNLNVVEVGVTSAPALVWEIKNNGTSTSGTPALSNSNPTELLVASNGCMAPLAAGQSCTITFAFQASMGGSRTGTLTLNAAPGGVLRYTVSAMGGYRVTVTKSGDSGTARITSTTPGIDCGTTCSAVFANAVTLQARGTNGSGLVFSSWGGDTTCSTNPSVECGLTLTKPVTLSASFVPQTANLIFVTSKTFPGNRGNAAGFDVECNAAATDVGINNAAGNDFVAMVSDSASTGRSRLGANARG